MTDKTSISAHTCPVPARNAALRSFSSRTPSNRPTVAPTSTSLHCHTRLLPAALCTIHRKTSTSMPNRNSNPIDPPASTPPAAHFKRLYRNCPTLPATPLTPARGSHDRVLTFPGESPDLQTRFPRHDRLVTEANFLLRPIRSSPVGTRRSTVVVSKAKMKWR